MKKLNNLKLTSLSEANLQEKEMNQLRGGDDKGCGCACVAEGNGGSTKETNSSANYKTGTWSPSGCIQQITWYYSAGGYASSFPTGNHA